MGAVPPSTATNSSPNLRSQPSPDPIRVGNLMHEITRER